MLREDLIWSACCWEDDTVCADPVRTMGVTRLFGSDIVWLAVEKIIDYIAMAT